METFFSNYVLFSVLFLKYHDDVNNYVIFHEFRLKDVLLCYFYEIPSMMKLRRIDYKSNICHRFPVSFLTLTELKEKNPMSVLIQYAQGYFVKQE